MEEALYPPIPSFPFPLTLQPANQQQAYRSFKYVPYSHTRLLTYSEASREDVFRVGGMNGCYAVLC